MLSVLTVINNLTESSTATLTLSSHVIVTETHSQWHHSTAHILIDTHAHAHTHTHMHAHRRTQTHTDTHTHTQRNTHRGITTCLTKFNPLSYPFWLCCVQRVEIWATGQQAIFLTFLILLIISDVLRLMFSSIFLLHLLVTSVVMCLLMMTSPIFTYIYACWLQVTSSGFLITSIVLPCLLVMRVLLFVGYKYCPPTLAGYIGCCPLMFADCKWHPPVSWLKALSFSVCWLHVLSSNVRLLQVLSSYVCWLQMLSSYVCWQVLSYVFWLQVLSYVCWLQMLSYVCWLKVLS